MKKLFSYALSAALLLGLGSCSEELDKGGDVGTTGKSAMSFTVKTGKGNLVTYADGDIAQGSEWTINEISVYAFDADGAAVDTDTFTIETEAGTTTITADDAWMTDNKGETINFYFVANDESANLFGETSHIDGTITTEADFIEQITAAQELDATDENRAKHLTAPLLFTAKASVEVPSIGKVTVPVSLKRREARFDVVNTLDGFDIDKIIVRNANIEGYVFAEAKKTQTVTKSDLKEVTTIPAYDADGLAASVFYLYPTVLGTDNTEIAIVATVNGEQNAYPVNSNARIDANKRYKLVLNPNELVFEVEVADYDDVENDISIAPVKKLTIDEIDMASGNATFDNISRIFYVDANDGASEFEMTVYAASPAGLDVKFENVYGAGASTLSTVSNTTDAVITYSTVGYKTDVKIKIGEYTGTESFLTRIIISDKKTDAEPIVLSVQHEGTEPIVDEETGEEVVYYPGTDLKAVKLGGVWWAPVNVGATTINNSKQTISSIGYHFQWGRNVPLDPNNLSGTIEGPMSYEDAHKTDKFITVDQSNVRNWCSDPENQNWDGDNPCPKGWSIASYNNYKSISSLKPNGEDNEPNALHEYDNLDNFLKGRTSFRGDNGDRLFFPFAGQIGGNGNMAGRLSSAAYWSTYKGVTDNGLNAYMLTGGGYFPGWTLSVGEAINWTTYPYAAARARVVACPIRCVKDVE